MNKKGLELPVSMMVLLILAILMFGLGIYMVRLIFGGAGEIQTQLEARTEEEIERLIRQENALVAVPFSNKEVRKGGVETFGIGVRNVRNQPLWFSAVTNFKGAFSKDGTRIIIDCDTDAGKCDYIRENWLGGFAVQPPIQLQAKQFEAISTVIKAEHYVEEGESTSPGTYQFIVCVYSDDEEGKLQNQEKMLQDCTVENMNKFYSKKVYPITVRVD